MNTDTNTGVDLSLWQLIDDAKSLVDGGAGLRFEVEAPKSPNSISNAMLPAFVLQYDGQSFAYLNQCAHVAMEMDWQHGVFFDLDQRFIMCATHGALYEPESGLCVAGPCTGEQLKSVPLMTHHGKLYAARTV